jgi:hypothetical protein
MRQTFGFRRSSASEVRDGLVELQWDVHPRILFNNRMTLLSPLICRQTDQWSIMHGDTLFTKLIRIEKIHT